MEEEPEERMDGGGLPLDLSRLIRGGNGNVRGPTRTSGESKRRF